MPMILTTDRKSWRMRGVIALIYLLLSLGGLTMILPFLITVTASFTDRFEYDRFLPYMKSLWTREDRFVRSLEAYSPNALPVEVFPDAPKTWGTWLATGSDPDLIRAFAAPYLAVERDPARLAQWRRMAADYADFFLDYDVRNTVCAFDFRDLAGFLRDEYESKVRARDPARFAALSTVKREAWALEALKAEWKVPYLSFFGISFEDERSYAMHHVSWNYPDTAKARAFTRFKDAYRTMTFRPGAERQWRAWQRQQGARDPAGTWPLTPGAPQWAQFKQFVGENCPASPTRPYLLQPLWLKHLDSVPVRERLGLPAQRPFAVEDYNRMAGSAYRELSQVPFPLPAEAPAVLREEWRRFVREAYPRRLIRLQVTPELQAAYQAQLRQVCHTIDAYNRLTGATLTGFDQIVLPARDKSEHWRTFVADVPYANLILESPETDWQAYLLRRYGNVAAINAAYGWSLARLEEARLPVAEAITVTFFNHEWSHYFWDVASNYVTVFDYLFHRGRAFLNTVILISLAIFATLTVNPLAAYALSRFRFRHGEQILLFLLATMAFPAAVSAIPAFLLMRDLNLLNTISALVLPGLANGLAIFILKGFFDGLPRELYEAAAIDGAREWQILFHITLPMTTPILAVNTLNAFIQAYNSWEWALLVCQKSDYWTLAVWLYQFTNLSQLEQAPFIIMAAFVVASVPTAIVFIACQKVILRGIVIPSMK